MSLNKHELNRMLNLARAKLTGASEAELKAELFELLHEFFNETSTWTETISVDIIPATTEFNIAPSDSGTIIRLAGVVNENNLPEPAVMSGFGVLTFKNPYNQAQTFQASVVKNVVLPTSKDQVPDAPDWVLTVFSPTILAGLLGKMMSSPNKPYTNDTLSVYHLKRFRDGMAMARVAKLRANTFGTQRWVFPGFARGSQRGGSSGDRTF